jgi:hypothetical protein
MSFFLAMALGGGVAFLVLLCFRPRGGLTRASLALSAVIYGAALLMVFTFAKAAGSENIELRVLDPNGAPVPGPEVTFEHYPKGGGLAGLRAGSSASHQTDSSGMVVIETDRRHLMQGRIVHPAYAEVSFTVDRDWGGDRQQFTASWLDPRIPHPKGEVTATKDIRAFHGYLTSSRHAVLTVYLPRPGQDGALPYATQE